MTEKKYLNLGGKKPWQAHVVAFSSWFFFCSCYCWTWFFCMETQSVINIMCVFFFKPKCISMSNAWSFQLSPDFNFNCRFMFFTNTRGKQQTIVCTKMFHCCRAGEGLSSWAPRSDMHITLILKGNQEIEKKIISLHQCVTVLHFIDEW